MKRRILLGLIIFSLLTSCSKNKEVANDTRSDLLTSTPTTAPNTMPYAVFFSDQLYLYDSDFKLENEDISELVLVGEITDYINLDKLPSINFQTNIECLLPTPLFVYGNDASKLVMEVNSKISSRTKYDHKYFLFTLQVDD